MFSGKGGSVIKRFKPFGSNYAGGLSVALGDLTGDGIAEIVVGRAGNSGSGVRVYEGKSFSRIAAFQAFPGTDSGGIDVATAQTQSHGDVVVVSSLKLGGVVRYYSLDGSLLSVLHPYGSSAGFGITVATADLNNDGYDEIIVSPAWQGNRARVIDADDSKVLAHFTAGEESHFGSGIRLGTMRTTTGPDTLLIGNGIGAEVSVLAFKNLQSNGVRLKPAPTGRVHGIFVG